MKLNEKLREQLENAKTKDEMKAIIKESDIELSDEEIEAVVGGSIPEVPSFYSKDPNGAATAISS
ncbi:MAG: hypothetical protein K5641_00140 [Lachnospiraceae bacterium]|nr:hypothetical protein [Lachnospiraceae bacterium]